MARWQVSSNYLVASLGMKFNGAATCVLEFTVEIENHVDKSSEIRRDCLLHMLSSW